MNDYDVWNINSDLNREFLPLVAELQPAYLDPRLLRRRALRGRPAARRTVRHRQPLEDPEHRLVRSEQDAAGRADPAHPSRTTPRATSSCGARRWTGSPRTSPSTAPRPRVVVHRGWNTNLVRVPDRPEPIRMRRHKRAPRLRRRARQRAAGRRLDDYCVETFGWDAIDLRERGLHDVPRAPVGRLLGALRAGVLPPVPGRAAQDPPASRRFDADMLGPGRADREGRPRGRRAAARGTRRRWRTAVVRQCPGSAERIEELETLGVGRAVKFAVGPAPARPQGGGREGEEAVSRNVAVILAGGVGARVGLEIPKQLIKIAGHTILEHTLARFDAHPDVDEIVVMMAPGHLDAVARDRPRRRLHQGQARARGRRDPQRHHADGARGRRGRRRQGAAPRRRPPAGQHAGSSASASRRWTRTTPSTWPSRRPTRSSRSTSDNVIRGHPAARQPAPRPDPAGVPGRHDPRRRTPQPRRTPTSRPPTTAPSCCATCPTSRSGWSPATSAT